MTAAFLRPQACSTAGQNFPASLLLGNAILAIFFVFFSQPVLAALPNSILADAFGDAVAATEYPKGEGDKKRMAARQISGSPWPGIIDHRLQTPIHDFSAGEANIDISINYPSVGNSEIDKDIRDWVSQIATVFENHLNPDLGIQPVAGGDELPEDYSQPDPPRFELFGNYTVSQPSRNAISVTFELWNYLNSSQGNLDIITLNYSALSGKRLDLVDIFEDPELALKIMSEYSRKTLEMRLGAARHTQMLLSGTEPLAENFASLTLTPKGVCINFQPYQVASWSVGIQKVEMSLEDLAMAKPMLALWGRP